MSNFAALVTRRRVRRAHGAAIVALLAAACTGSHATALATLCAGGAAVANIDATVDSLRPPAGPALMAMRGTHFALRFRFAAAASAERTPVEAARCTGRSGTATFDGTLPDPLRNATAPARRASWRVEGDMVLLDLNPGTRDNNIFVALPLQGGPGHWGWSTFAGEVASGATVSRR